MDCLHNLHLYLTDKSLMHKSWSDVQLRLVKHVKASSGNRSNKDDIIFSLEVAEDQTPIFEKKRVL